MNLLKNVGATALVTIALSTYAVAETTVTLPDVNAEVYGKLSYMGYYNEDTSGNGVWKAGNNASRVGISISEAGDMNAFGKIEVGVNVDDAGSDTFSSRLAYLGVDSPLGAISVGRQNSVFTGVTGATDVFNVYGSNADNNQGSRLSNTLVYSTSMGPASVSTLVQMDGKDTNKDIDIYETAVGFAISCHLGDSTLLFVITPQQPATSFEHNVITALRQGSVRCCGGAMIMFPACII